ncbi:hypothetical protein BH11ARM2_BH11ARM2_33040 [soil metagenome]
MGSVVASDPGVLFGAPVFIGTRVPTEALFDYLEAGDTLDDFLRDFPAVRRETAVRALRGANRTLVERELAGR